MSNPCMPSKPCNNCQPCQHCRLGKPHSAGMFSKRMSCLLKKKKLSVNKFCEMFPSDENGDTAIKLPTLYTYYNGTSTPSVEKAALIADMLGVSMDYLQGRTDDALSHKRSTKNQTYDYDLMFSDFMALVDRHIVFPVIDQPSTAKFSFTAQAQVDVSNIYLSDTHHRLGSLMVNRYVVINGNIYTEEMGYAVEGDNISAKSIYDFANEIIADEQKSSKEKWLELRKLEKLKKAYRKARFSYGVLGTLSADTFYWLNYITGRYHHYNP